jgi:hypothetical protein
MKKGALFFLLLFLGYGALAPVAFADNTDTCITTTPTASSSALFVATIPVEDASSSPVYETPCLYTASTTEYSTTTVSVITPPALQDPATFLVAMVLMWTVIFCLAFWTCTKI